MPSKQAVLLIHGIGEQRPMDTLRGFVETVWTHDTTVHNAYAGATTWSKPDLVSRSFELRRLTTPRNAAGIRTDFYEFYWAHLMQGTTYGHVLGWARRLLWRRPGTVPAHLRGAYWTLVATVVAAVALALYGSAALAGDGAAALPGWASLASSLVIVPLAGFVLTAIVGDAARYLHVAPANIQCRHEIRQAGVELLDELHRRGYDRIIVVGHSLGSVIGYDILYHAWASLHAKQAATPPATAALDEVERQTVAPGANDTQDTYRQAQRAFARELRANGNPWRVTDFVTLGSPLAHAAVLLADDKDDLASKQQARELPTCPPCTETVERAGRKLTRFSYEADGGKSRVPHHAALFAATRWTNLYFPCRALLWGDVVGGPLAAWFGGKVRDVAVGTRLRAGLLSHTLYWKRPTHGPAPHIDALRTAVNLTDG